MSRFREYIERSAPLFFDQAKKFWRSEYLYAEVLNAKRYGLGRLGIEVNLRYLDYR